MVRHYDAETGAYKLTVCFSMTLRQAQEAGCPVDSVEHAGRTVGNFGKA